MNNSEQGQAFLREQIGLLDHKIRRLSGALAACQACLEAESLQTMLGAAQAERALLEDLLAHQTNEHALALDLLLLQRIEQARRTAQDLPRWQLGRPTPAAYWEAEARRAFLTSLLGQFHAWQAGRSYYPEVDVVAAPRKAPVHIHLTTHGRSQQYPWYLPILSLQSGEGDEPETSDHLVAFAAMIVDLLRRHNLPDHHLEIIVQPLGSVIVKGIAHSDTEHEQIVSLIRSVPGVQELVSAIDVIPEGRCPVCRSESQ